EGAVGHVEVDAVEDGQLLLLATIDFTEVADLDDRFGGARNGSFGHYCFSLIRCPSFRSAGGARTMRVPAGGPWRSETRFPSGGPVTTGTLRTLPSGCTVKTALVSPRSTTLSGCTAGVGAAFCAASSSSRA